MHAGDAVHTEIMMERSGTAAMKSDLKDLHCDPDPEITDSARQTNVARLAARLPSLRAVSIVEEAAQPPPPAGLRSILPVVRRKSYLAHSGGCP